MRTFNPLSLVLLRQRQPGPFATYARNLEKGSVRALSLRPVQNLVADLLQHARGEAFLVLRHEAVHRLR